MDKFRKDMQELLWEAELIMAGHRAMTRYLMRVRLREKLRAYLASPEWSKMASESAARARTGTYNDNNAGL